MELPPTGYPHTQVADVTIVILVVPHRPWDEHPPKKSTRVISTSEEARDRNEGASGCLALERSTEPPSGGQQMDVCPHMPD